MNAVYQYAQVLVNPERCCDHCHSNGNVLYRYNEPGADGIYWCEKCLKENEPELLKEHKEDAGDIIKEALSVFGNKSFNI